MKGSVQQSVMFLRGAFRPNERADHWHEKLKRVSLLFARPPVLSATRVNPVERRRGCAADSPAEFMETWRKGNQ